MHTLYRRVLISMLVLTIASVAANILSGAVEGACGKPSPMLDYMTTVLEVSAGITVWIQSFKVRRILLYHFNVRRGGNLKISWILTLLFTNLYLQYKINRIA